MEAEYDIPEVKGYDCTLVQAIEQQLCDQPPLCDWNVWQQWRRDVGLRPDIPRAQEERRWFYKRETRLHRDLMTMIYGLGWNDLLADQQGDDAADEGEAEVAFQRAERVRPVPAEGVVALRGTTETPQQDQRLVVWCPAAAPQRIGSGQ